MPSPSGFLAFAAAALVLLLIPGPAVLYIVARSMSQGRLAGVVSALGTTMGALVHVLAAALGLSAPRALRRLFTDGVLVSVLNPKTALFFLAFLPQFVDRSRGPAGIQVVVLGMTFAAMALCTDSAYALLAGTARRWVGVPGAAKAWPRYVSGAVQYVSHPSWSWQTLRSERPGVYERAVVPELDGDEWFHVRIVIAPPKVSVFGEGSGGYFANLRATRTK